MAFGRSSHSNATGRSRSLMVQLAEDLLSAKFNKNDEFAPCFRRRTAAAPTAFDAEFTAIIAARGSGVNCLNIDRGNSTDVFPLVEKTVDETYKVFDEQIEDAIAAGVLSSRTRIAVQPHPVAGRGVYLTQDSAREVGASELGARNFNSKELAVQRTAIPVWQETPVVAAAYARCDFKSCDRGDDNDSRAAVASLICALCFARLSVPQQPGGLYIACACGVERYCSEACKDLHWQAEHRALCCTKFRDFAAFCISQGSTALSKYPLLVAKLSAQAVLLRNRLGQAQTSDADLRIVGALRGVWQASDGSIELLNVEGLIACIVGLIVVEVAQEFGGSGALQNSLSILCPFWCSVLKCNLFAFQIPGEPQYMTDMGGAGGALLRIGSMFNHSCDPNCQMSAQVDASGTRFHFFALPGRASVGDELCISYVSRKLESPERRALLRSTFDFECVCLNCVSCL